MSGTEALAIALGIALSLPVPSSVFIYLHTRRSEKEEYAGTLEQAARDAADSIQALRDATAAVGGLSLARTITCQNGAPRLHHVRPRQDDLVL